MTYEFKQFFFILQKNLINLKILKNYIYIYISLKIYIEKIKIY